MLLLYRVISVGKMALHNTLCDLFDIRYPCFQHISKRLRVHDFIKGRAQYCFAHVLEKLTHKSGLFFLRDTFRAVSFVLG